MSSCLCPITFRRPRADPAFCCLLDSGRPDFEQGENEEDELEEGVPEPEESDQLADTPVDQAVEGATSPL